MLEPCAGKLVRTVLRGPGAGNSFGLPDADHLNMGGKEMSQITEIAPDIFKITTFILHFA
jgi:hypothetical protein